MPEQTRQTTSSSRDLHGHEAGPSVPSPSSSTALRPFLGGSWSPRYLGFETSEFLNDKDVRPMPNLHPRDPGYLYLSGISLETSQAKVTKPEVRQLSA